ncbi:MAG: hypothetical protein JKY65_13685 [Planctomycetes bacterium]|nr:hypothetical protein [Planctomycetota bacterium]
MRSFQRSPLLLVVLACSCAGVDSGGSSGEGVASVSSGGAVDAWEGFGPGSRFEFEVVISAPKGQPEFSYHGSVVYEVASLSEDQVEFEAKATVLGSSHAERATAPRENPSAIPTKTPQVDEMREVTVPAGTFSTRYRKWVVGDVTFEVWTGPRCPFPYRALSTGPRVRELRLAGFARAGEAIGSAVAAGAQGGDAAPVKSDTVSRSERLAANLWEKHGPGSTYEFTSYMKTRRPLVPFESVATVRQEIVSIGPEKVRFRVLTTFQGGVTETNEERPRSAPYPTLATNAPVVDEFRYVTVPAGTFQARYRKWHLARSMAKELHATLETWTSPSCPVAYRYLLTGPRTNEVQLVRMTPVPAR